MTKQVESMLSGRGDGGAVTGVLHDHFADKLFLPIRVIFALLHLSARQGGSGDFIEKLRRSGFL
jgi:hypothetical protein